MALMAGREIFTFTLYSTLFTISLSFINLEEIHNTKYGIKIASIPVLLKEDITNSMLLSSKHGQQYQCSLPEIEPEETEKYTKRIFTTKEVSDLLKQLEDKCLHFNKGWWTYEFCYGKSVSQYHEEGRAVVGNKISLGVYKNQTSWDDQEIEVPYSKNSSKRYHSQYFENGTDCDLNGAYRTTEVKFKCEVDAKDHIAMVNEPSSCTYILEVHTNKLCDHPLFKPPASGKPLDITCSPALSEEHYQAYLTSVELEKKAKAKAIADRIRKMQAQDDEYDDEYDDIERPRKRKTPQRSQLWPWDTPGVESKDETLISGDINKKSMAVNRLDVIKGRKFEENGQEAKDNGAITIMSRRMSQDRYEQKDGIIEDVVDESKKQNQKENKGKENDRMTETKIEDETKDAEKKDEITETKIEDETKDAEKKDEITETKIEDETKDAEEKDEITETKIEDETKDAEKKVEGEKKELDENEQEQLNNELPQAGMQEEIGLKPGFKIFTPSSSSKVIGKVDGEEAKAMEDQNLDRKTVAGRGGEDSKKEKLPKESPRKKQRKKKKRNLEDEWKDALIKARMQLKSVVRKQLKGMGVDPDALEDKFETMSKRTSQAKDNAKPTGEKPETSGVESKTENVPSMEGLKAAVDRKLKKLMQSVEQMEKDGKLDKNSKERRVLNNIQKIMHGMDHQNVLLMKKEETIQRELEKHFDELKDRFNIEVEMMKRFLEEFADRDGDDAYREDEYLKTIVEKLKNSLHRFDRSNRALSHDMEAVKQINKEVHAKIDDIVSGDATDKKSKSSEFFRLAGKANSLLRRLLQRSSQLDKEMRDMKEISDQVKARSEEYADAMEDDPNVIENKRLKRRAEARLSGIVDKLKKMFSDINQGGQGAETPDADPDAMSDMADTDSPNNIKVRVSKIKGDDGKALWSDGSEEEILEDKADGEMGIEEKLKRASKRMEKMVKKQLESAGINPGGKVRVKIITSRDALENFGGRKGMDILSEEETTQFKKMILNLMGGSSEAGDEKRRHLEMENNYNLVWHNNGLKKAPPPDEDEPDAELVFDDTEGMF